ncbi:MAG TPA: glycosyltransferase family 2 protein [Spirosoma sp.]|nr:glycosyltransferase family 2 protein [Spirosoma sp.]
MENHFSISVAMCTYNGERYILEQLESIAHQDRLPNELIIVDDRSVDGTLIIVREFAQAVSFPVYIIENAQNTGSTKSFERAVKACTGDIIAFADQDDVWNENRLAKTELYFYTHPDMDAVFSNAEVINDDSIPQGRSIWDEVQFTAEAQTEWAYGKAYQKLFSGYIVTGATLSIRRSILPQITPFPTHVPILIHDAWIALIMALHGRIGFMTDCLISYRMHTHQQVGFKPARTKVTLRDRLTRGRESKLAYVRKMANRYQQLYELLSSRPDIDKKKIRLLERLKDHYTTRVNLPVARFRRIWPVIRELLESNYQLNEGRWWLTAIGDLLED